MKTKVEELRDELTQVMEDYARNYPTLPTFFPPELVERVVQYVREQGTQGVSVADCSKQLGISQPRLHYWLYGRKAKIKAPMQRRSPALRPVQVSAELVPVYDGVRERRYTVRSPAGWEVKDLTIKELTEILRGLV
jgi:hypothetical protein